MKRLFIVSVCFGAFFLVTPITANAAQVGAGVWCPGLTSWIVTDEVGVTVSCQSYQSSANALVSSVESIQTNLGYHSYSEAHASSNAEIAITFTGGTGSGYFVPCLEGTFDDTGYATATFTDIFGNSDTSDQISVIGHIKPDTCSFRYSTLGRPLVLMPFTYGTPAVGQLHLDANMTATASLYSFQLYDAAGNLVSTTPAYSIADVPEPNGLWWLAVGLGGLLWRLRSSHSNGTNVRRSF